MSELEKLIDLVEGWIYFAEAGNVNLLAPDASSAWETITQRMRELAKENEALKARIIELENGQQKLVRIDGSDPCAQRRKEDETHRREEGR